MLIDVRYQLATVTTATFKTVAMYCLIREQFNEFFQLFHVYILVTVATCISLNEYLLWCFTYFYSNEVYCCCYISTL